MFVRATVTANAVERMRMKCEQKTAAVVSEATLSLSHDLKKSDRHGFILQRQLQKAAVNRPLPLKMLLTLLD